MDKIAAIMDSWYGRLIRSGISTGLGVLAAKYQNNPLYISLTPMLQAASKFARDKWPNSLWEVLPF